MKKLLIICLLVSSFVFALKGHSLYTGSTLTANDTVQVVTTQELSGLMALVFSNYVPGEKDAFVKLNIEDKEDLSSVGGDKIVIKSEVANTVSNTGKWSLTIGRDILVPVISKESKYLDILRESGIKPSVYASALKDESGINWGSVSGTNDSQKVKLLYSELSVERLASFAGIENSEIRVKAIESNKDIGSLIKKEKNAIAFCRLSDMLNRGENSILEGLEIVPVDINENGTVDHFENYCSSYSELVRAVWIGKYPKALFNEIKIVTDLKPQDKSTVDLIAWILTQGQNSFLTADVTELQSTERRSALNTLYSLEIPSVGTETAISASRTLYWVIGIMLTLFAIGIIVMFSKRKTVLNVEKISSSRILDLSVLKAPAGLLFDKSHTWSYMERDGLVKVGLDDFMQHITGKISRIELKNVGDSVKRGQDLFTIVQDGKHLVIKSPISAKIESINTILESNSSTVNDSPYTDGWIYTLKPDNWMAEYGNFFIGEKYSEWINKELLRLKEFISSAVFKQQTQGMQLVMQDGGEIIDNLMESMGPELWEEFQLGFINTK